MLLSISEQKFSQAVFESSTPVLVHFWAPWCGVCRLIDPLLKQFEQSWAGQVKIVGINADSSLKLASTYKLTTLPTLILFEDSKVLFRFEHFQGRENLRQTLDAFMQSYEPSPQRQILQPQSALVRG
jgi:thioredoxin 1